jgi:hypothetical protein
MEFAAATLNHEEKPEKQISILREMHDEGIGYVPIDAENSTDVWKVGSKDDKKILIGPVQNVKGIGPKLTQQIVSARARNEPIPERAQKLLQNASTNLDTLWPISDRVNELWPDLTEKGIITKPTPINDITEDHTKDTSFLIIGVAEIINPRDENEVGMVARRGGKTINDGKTESLNLQIRDDTGIVYCKIGRFKFKNLKGKEVIDRGRPKKSIYAIKGTALAGRRFLMVDKIRYLGDMEQEHEN